MESNELKKWDVVDHLRTDEEMAEYFDACLEEEPGDGSLVRAALDDIATAKGMTALARDTGLTREGLNKTFSANGNPEFTTVMKVIKTMGLRLDATCGE